jgi:hypothetical protein
MNLKSSVAELQKEHIVMELESIDRMYLNAYVPQLTTEAGVAGFVRGYLGHRFASTKQVAEMTESFVEAIMQFSLDHKIDLVRFQKGQRKDDDVLAQRRLRNAQQRRCPPKMKGLCDGSKIPAHDNLTTPARGINLLADQLQVSPVVLHTYGARF